MYAFNSDDNVDNNHSNSDEDENIQHMRAKHHKKNQPQKATAAEEAS
jgi:hypothetical protein